MISVPLAGLLPSTPRPVRFMNGSMTSSGKPYGYVGIACGVTTPISSQWPVVVSFPFDRSTSRPAIAGAPGCGAHPSSASTLPRPSASSVGRSRPPTARATLASVLEPESPNSSASGSSPAPTASSTMTQARGTRLSYFRGNGARPTRNRSLHHVRDRAGSKRDLDRGQGQPEARRQEKENRDDARGLTPGFYTAQPLDDGEREHRFERGVVEAVRLRDGLVRDLPVDHVHAFGERRVGRDGGAQAVAGNGLDVRERRVRERLRRGNRYPARHVRDAVMRDFVDDVHRVGVRRRV